ncbi:hypothetical protein BS47DRAFT_461344 [Hydnum rufescens UP504]|uniref:Fungal-type protein kinase domain-containing protein n=1 Tax=Hydnum rufescens UP504 TaxID=1448309 RepID=A0A9P6AHV1_9AGAM|nr:hypothetical protein BS47DRAFT_461344 [Hydnum rufescens UP504]
MRFENDDNRVLRVIVMDSYFPATQLHTTSNFTQVIIDVVKCHRALHDGPKILHRDISMNSLMFRRGKDKRAIGILIDFDLAVFVEIDPQYGSLHLNRRFRTGAPPFMALDLLDGTDKIHWVRYDLESFLWVTVWYTARYHEGIEATMAFQLWRKTNMTQLAVEKNYFLMTTEMYEPTEHFGKVAHWVGSLVYLFVEALHARNVLRWKAKYGGGQTSETLDMETLGGRVTYQIFLRILEEE